MRTAISKGRVRAAAHRATKVQFVLLYAKWPKAPAANLTPAEGLKFIKVRIAAKAAAWEFEARRRVVRERRVEAGKRGRSAAVVDP